MIKNLILKFNNFIQWTKKWIVCHLFINTFAVFLILGLIIEMPLNTETFLDTISVAMFFIYVMLLYVLPINLLISIIENIKEKRLFVKNNILLYDKNYNLYYTSVLIIILLSFLFVAICLYPYALLYFVIYSIFLLIFTILKIILIKVIVFLKKLFK